MPRRAVRCIVDLNLSAVSAPGCWLPSKEDCYLSVSLFSQFKNTQLLGSTFPILINESFRFEKTYFTALDVEDVSELLEDELVVIELLQLSEYSDGAVHLATYTNNVRDFLYPYDTYKTSFHSRDRDIFLERTVAFPGISPKLEFSSKVILKESYSEELDALEDAIDYHKSTIKDIRRSRRRPRSLSPSRRNRPSNKITSKSITWKARRTEDTEVGMERLPMRRVADDFEVDYETVPGYAPRSRTDGRSFDDYRRFTKERDRTRTLQGEGPAIDYDNYQTFTERRTEGMRTYPADDMDLDLYRRRPIKRPIRHIGGHYPADDMDLEIGKRAPMDQGVPFTSYPPIGVDRDAYRVVRDMYYPEFDPNHDNYARKSIGRKNLGSYLPEKIGRLESPKHQRGRIPYSSDDYQDPLADGNYSLGRMGYPNSFDDRYRPYQSHPDYRNGYRSDDPDLDRLRRPRYGIGRERERPSVDDLDIDIRQQPRLGGRRVYPADDMDDYLRNLRHPGLNGYTGPFYGEPSNGIGPKAKKGRVSSPQQKTSLKPKTNLHKPTIRRRSASPRRTELKDPLSFTRTKPPVLPYSKSLPKRVARRPLPGSVDSPRRSTLLQRPISPSGTPRFQRPMSPRQTYLSQRPDSPGRTLLTRPSSPSRGSLRQRPSSPGRTSLRQRPSSPARASLRQRPSSPRGVAYTSKLLPPKQTIQRPGSPVRNLPVHRPGSPQREITPLQSSYPQTSYNRPYSSQYPSTPQYSSRLPEQSRSPLRLNSRIPMKDVIKPEDYTSVPPRPRVVNHKLDDLSSGYGKPDDYDYLYRATSPTLSQRIEDIDLYAYSDNRPPFVVRKLDDDLIGRQPGGLLAVNAKSKPHKSLRVNKNKNKLATDCCPLCKDAYTLKCCCICQAYKHHLGRLYWGHNKGYHPTGHVCLSSYRQFSSSLLSPLSKYSYPTGTGKSYLVNDLTDSEDDSEVAGYTSRVRARSVSPGRGLYRPRSLSPRSHRVTSPALSKVPVGDRSSRRDTYTSPRLTTSRSPYRRRNTDLPLSYYGRDVSPKPDRGDISNLKKLRKTKSARKIPKKFDENKDPKGDPTGIRDRNYLNQKYDPSLDLDLPETNRSSDTELDQNGHNQLGLYPRDRQDKFGSDARDTPEGQGFYARGRPYRPGSGAKDKPERHARDRPDRQGFNARDRQDTPNCGAGNITRNRPERQEQLGSDTIGKPDKDIYGLGERAMVGSDAQGRPDRDKPSQNGIASKRPDRYDFDGRDRSDKYGLDADRPERLGHNITDRVDPETSDYYNGSVRVDAADRTDPYDREKSNGRLDPDARVLLDPYGKGRLDKIEDPAFPASVTSNRQENPVYRSSRRLISQDNGNQISGGDPLYSSRSDRLRPETRTVDGPFSDYVKSPSYAWSSDSDREIQGTERVRPSRAGRVSRRDQFEQERIREDEDPKNVRFKVSGRDEGFIEDPSNEYGRVNKDGIDEVDRSSRIVSDDGTGRDYTYKYKQVHTSEPDNRDGRSSYSYSKTSKFEETKESDPVKRGLDMVNGYDENNYTEYGKNRSDRFTPRTSRADAYYDQVLLDGPGKEPLPSRPVSPVLNKARFRDRFSEAPFFSTSSKLSERAVERSHRYRYPTHDTLDDLALDTSLAKYRSQVHIDNGHYWTENAAKLSGKSHRQLFNDNLSKMYNRLYKHSTSLHN